MVRVHLESPYGELAQWLEHLVYTEGVRGSNPLFPTIIQSGGIGKRKGLLIPRFGLWDRTPPLEPNDHIF